MTNLTTEESGFTVKRIAGCRVVFGNIPLSDFEILTHGFGVDACVAPDIADRIGASLVIGEPEDLVRLRAMTLTEVGDAVARFLNFAGEHPELRFRLTRVGCGLAGFRDADIAPLFFPAPPNVIMPGIWQRMKDGKTVRLIIAGSRTITSRDYVFSELDRLTQGLMVPANQVTEICGDARGIDTLGGEWATSKGIAVELFPALWDRHGKAAGMIRNKVMANHGTHLVAFWDGVSPGTRQMIDVAKNFMLGLRVVRTDGCSQIYAKNR